VLCRASVGPRIAQCERFEPCAVALDPLMRSPGPSRRRIGAQGHHEVARPDATRMRGQLCPEATEGAGGRQRQDGWADVVVGRTTLPLTPYGQGRRSEQGLHPLRQFLTRHAEHLQLPITGSYLLLERSLRLIDERSHLDLDALGQQGAQELRQVRYRGRRGHGRVQAEVEVLAVGLAPRGQRQPEADQRVGHEALGVGQLQAAAPEGPLPHPGHVTVAGEADLPGLGEAESQPVRVLRWHG